MALMMGWAMTYFQQQARSRARLRLFLSYARDNKEAMRPVVEGLETLHHEIWIDKKLDGGQAWWEEILMQIRGCDAMIVAVSPALLESEAATRERGYARQLGKPLLPVLIAPLLTDLLPSDLAPLQLIDYTNIGPMTGFQLAGSLTALPPTPPLPNPLPTPPLVPVSYLTGVADRLREPSMSLEAQLELVGILRLALGRPREREAAAELIQALRQRRDVYYATWQELDKLTPGESHHPPGRPPASGPSAPAAQGEAAAPVSPRGAAVPPGWYPDPSGRHQLRWFDNDWTRYASDYGAVVEDQQF